MSDQREPPSLTDLTVAAISPALIIGMLWGLVFFLVDVLYVGRYEARLNYTLFFYILGIVLVARVSIVVDAARATTYGAALSLVSFVAMRRFVEFPPDVPLAPFSGLVNLGLLALTWYLAHKITWDCTHIDERKEASDKGLLAAAGLEEQETPGDGLKKKRKKPHTPGLWVVYFGLAALPVFALGQSLIPSEDGGRRAYTFRLMGLFVGSGLGLLMTTSFLGLRRYLRQRGMEMPARVTGIWLGVGGAMVVAFLLLGGLLPRPHAEYGLFSRGSGDSGEPGVKASENAVRGDSPGEGGGRGGDESEAGDGHRTGDKGKKSGRGEGRGKKGGGSKSGKKQSGGRGQKGKSGKGRDDRDDRRDRDDDNDEQGGGSGSRSERKTDGGDRDGTSSDSSGPLGRALETIGSILKWVLFAVIAVAVILVIVFGGLGWWPSGLRQWLGKLFGRKPTEDVAEEPVEEAGPEPLPFSAFASPFAGGPSGTLSQLIRYSFAALEAWARDRGDGRRPEETPLEFARRLAGKYPDVGEPIRKLAGLYTRLAYAGNAPASAGRKVVEQFWTAF